MSSIAGVTLGMAEGSCRTEEAQESAARQAQAINGCSPLEVIVRIVEGHDLERPSTFDFLPGCYIGQMASPQRLHFRATPSGPGEALDCQS
jgi:hypothetical protein